MNITLEERIQETRSLCRTMLSSSPLAEAEASIAGAGLTPEVCSHLLRAGSRRKSPVPELLALPRNERQRLAPYGFALERALLVRTAIRALDEIPGLPVDESVKHLFCREFSAYAKPPAVALEDFTMDGLRFAAMSGIVSLSRFPAGQCQWIVSGFPRSWFLKVSVVRIPGLCRFFAAHTHGREPFFEPHLNGTSSRLTFVTEREYLKSFYRMAAAIEKQPRIKGMMCSSWLYSEETHRINPHLAFFSRPYMEVGGFHVDLGPADPESGFLKGDPQRAELYRSGEYRPTNALVMCSRDQAIAWKQTHSEIAELLNVGESPGDDIRNSGKDR